METDSGTPRVPGGGNTSGVQTGSPSPAAQANGTLRQTPNLGDSWTLQAAEECLYWPDDPPKEQDPNRQAQAMIQQVLADLDAKWKLPPNVFCASLAREMVECMRQESEFLDLLAEKVAEKVIARLGYQDDPTY